jgi:GMP synthase-like glutamine amidotransferase
MNAHIPVAFTAMQPVAIFRHSPTEGPGYFAIFLERQGIPWRLIAIDEGEPVPVAVDGFSGLCFMGGPMSVNDPLPWIEPVCSLIRQAVAQDVPVIGHCLGGQLMSKALGGKVTRNAVKEIGWGKAGAEGHTIARHWLGDFAGKSGTVFQWHGETFSIPPGATRLLANAHCANQMFALGPHLGMQCHVEMTPEMIATWCGQWADEATAVADQPSVQTPEAMQSEIAERLPVMRQLSEQLYSIWIKGLRR